MNYKIIKNYKGLHDLKIENILNKRSTSYTVCVNNCKRNLNKIIFNKNCNYMFNRFGFIGFKKLSDRSSRNVTGVIPKAWLYEFNSYAHSILNVYSNMYSTTSYTTFSTKDQGERTLAEEKLRKYASEINVIPVTSDIESELPDPSVFDLLSSYIPLLERFIKAQEIVNYIKAKHRVTEGVELTTEQQMEVKFLLEEQGIDVLSVGIDDFKFPLREIVVSDESAYSFNDVSLNLEHERNLFLLNLVNIHYASKYPQAILSLDQLKALSKNNAQMSKFFSDVKAMFNFTLSIDSAMFKAGVTPAEFKQFIADKKSVSRTFQVKQAYQKGLSQKVDQMKRILIDMDFDAYTRTSIIYKINRIAVSMLPVPLSDAISLRFPMTKEIEENLAKAAKVFRKYVLYLYKNRSLHITEILSSKERELLQGFEFTESSFEAYLTYLTELKYDSVKSDVVK